MGKRALPAAAAILLLLCACGASVPQADPKAETPQAETFTITDDLGRTVSLERPERVAAMIGSFADIWCLAGGRDSLTAAAHDAWTSFDLHLDDGVADLGAIKEPNLERLLAVQPDLILASCNTAANVALLEVFEEAGLTAVYFDIQTVEDYLRMLAFCTELTGDAEAYSRWGLAVQQQVDQAIGRQDGSAPTVLCIRATGSGCKVKSSRDNVLGEMLADLGCVNIADQDGALLEELSLEAIIVSDPDYIFAVLQGADPSSAQEALETALLRNPAWSSLRAVREGRFYTLDHALYNLKPNARWGEAYEKLADILYPEA